MNVPEPEYNIRKGRVDIIFRLPEKKGKGVPEKKEILDGLMPTELKVYNMVIEGSFVTAGEMAEQIEVTEKTIRNTLTTLVEKGLIVRIGSKKTGKWVKQDRS